MFDGLWTIKFQVPGESRAMVIVINNGKIQGGNTEYFYLGECAIEGNRMNGNVTAHYYNGNADPVFMNAREIPLEVTGEINGSIMTGTARHAKVGAIPFTGTKRD